MHISSKVQRSLDKINVFLARTDYPESKRISYECTKNSLRYHQGVLQMLISKGTRRENYKGSHYMHCTSQNNSCECERDNAQILDHINDVNRLLRNM